MIISDVKQLVIGRRYVIRRGSKEYRVRFTLTGIDGDYMSVVIDGQTKVSQLNLNKALRRGIITA